MLNFSNNLYFFQKTNQPSHIPLIDLSSIKSLTHRALNVISLLLITIFSLSFSVSTFAKTNINPLANDDDSNHSISAKIVGGSSTQIGDIPWQAAILADPNDVFLSQYCGGALIAPKWVLTAAHCLDSITSTPYIGVGFVNLNNTTGGVIQISEQWFIHPDFGAPSFDNDIALIELAEPIDLAACGSGCATIDYITPADESTLAPLDTNATISGWGSTVAGANPNPNFPTNLLQAQVELVDCLSGTGLNPGNITSNMICAAASDFSRDSCQGDSGGPLTVANGSVSTLVGLVSFGIGCAVTNNPGVYTRIANYNTWIADVMNGDGCCANTGSDPIVENGSGGASINMGTTDGSGGAIINITRNDDGGGSFAFSFLLAIIAMGTLRVRFI